MMRYYQTTQPDLIKPYSDYLAHASAVHDACRAIATTIGATEPVFMGHILRGYRLSGFKFSCKQDADLWIENKTHGYWKLRAKAKKTEKAEAHKTLADQINGIDLREYCVTPTITALGITCIYTTELHIMRSKDGKTLLMASTAVPVFKGWDEITASQFEACGVSK